ncbi:MAG TPA: Stp1/IreP family PP2C-type Ser/Thr phosphatase [Gemmatimonadaceae bacterium]|nr:Stp1/IreP family PP2C-type Ser/Thr phosphatase [Gemmatimonadaceae bacterium]
MTAPSTPNSGEIIVHVFGKTDVGRTREHNEDAFVVADLNTMNATLQPEVRTHSPGKLGSLFMVADGMGGAAAGEVASAMATEVVLQELDTRWRSAAAHDAETFARAIKAAAETANARIHRYATEHPENRGMGTTATIAGLLGDTLYLAQVGDSRAYLVRNGTALQITKDQSLMQKLVEAGELTAEEAEVSERRNIILQALGPEPVVKVDLTHQQIRRNDVLILCSDGLSGQIRTTDIARVVAEDSDLVDVCKHLIDLANENGGPDNITVIAVRFDGSGLVSASAGEGVGHQVYTSQSEGRPTIPVDLGAVQALENAANAMPKTDRTVAIKRPTPVSQASPTTPMSPVANAPLPEGRVSKSTLRLIFGAIAVAILAYLFLKSRG